MTNRERVRNCGSGKPIDRTPFLIYFGPWPETTLKWRDEEGIINPNAWLEDFGFDKPVELLSNVVQHLHFPEFADTVLEKRGDHIIYQNRAGEIVEGIEGRSGIPKILKSPVTGWEEWEKLKEERLCLDTLGRFPKNFAQRAKELAAMDAPLQLGAYPCGLYGTLRDLMGVEGSLYAFYDQPELVKDIMNHLTDLWLGIYERVCKTAEVDIIHIWEDMSGKQGSLISPSFIKEFMAPNYRRIRDFADKHNIPVVQVDTDGDCEELIPLFAECGINMMMPFEVAAGSNVVELRKKHPYMAMMGGIDKGEIAKGEKAIDRELARIAPLIGKTGYIPALDHLIPPEVSYKDYSYFILRLKKMIFGE